ncbi:hypothetical protein CHS0354_004801 [Potamilus streckersoni]|uniref:Fucosyltransferase n=1 Tax=Potamilus streckersoni TaxID=2493646 RepID=A0AAE0VRP0_9BIVA|nr:hypothetical protein CHS0354_004801 [Potamilus streckersoni]
MLTCKAKLFILLLGFVIVVLSLSVLVWRPRNAYQFLTKERKHSLVDIPQLFSNFKLASNISSQKKMYKILWYSKPRWIKEKLLECETNMHKCKQTNCIIINNRSLLLESNALIFNVNGANFPIKPPRNPLQRNQNQVWIFFGLESPQHYWYHRYRSPEWKSMFNWTMTYRLDSDIPHPYGVLLTKSNPTDRDYRTIFRAKKKFAVWIVSHCGAVSRRDAFVRLLQKYVPVDIYGACGKNCSSEAGECKAVIAKEYKFYLSFENSLCKDYVTEKFFKYFPLDLITVQRGYSDYDSMLPNDTYINTDKFSTVEELANFMTRLADNEDEYILYLKAKDRYVTYRQPWTYCNALCDICQRLNNLEMYKRSYNDITSWLESDVCVKATDIK